MKKIFFVMILLTIFSCKSTIDRQFSVENEQIKAEFKVETEKFIKQNSANLSNAEMLRSLDSITEEYIINKNKKLAAKFIKSESGLKRLNFLKENFSKPEIEVLLKEIPETMKADTNYLSLAKYIKL